eukprot:SAG31_NODE_19800_length_591_cov_1.038618_1_plen_30_part_10
MTATRASRGRGGSETRAFGPGRVRGVTVAV